MNRSRFRNEILKELYGTSLRVLYEQTPPIDLTDPTAAPPADPTAAPPADPALAVPPAVPPVAPPPAIPGMPAMAPMAPMPGMPPVPGTPPAPAATPAIKKPVVHADIKGAIGRYLEKAEQKAIGAESESVESGNVGERVSRSLRNRSMSFLLEADDETALKEPELDIKVYTAEIARLIDDFTSLVDYKKITIDSATEYLKSHYPTNGESLGKEMVDLLDKEYHISLEPKEPQPDHYAKEAGGAGGSGGAA